MSYIAGDPQANVARQLVEGPALFGQNVIPVPGGFTPNMVDVFVGGACLSHGDYDDSDGMTIKLTLAMAAGTQYRVVSYAPGQTVQNITLNAPASFRNYIVDGNFESWINSSVNLGAAVWSNSAATMFYGYSGVGGAATMSLSQFYPGNEPLGMTSPIRNTLMYQQTTAASSAAIIQQNIESVATFQGRSATFSLWLFTTAGTLTIPSVFFNQYFGTGGSPSAGNYLAVPVSWQLTTTPQRFSVRIDVPSILGKTLGTNNNDYLAIGVNLPGNALYTIRTAQWQLEPCAATAPAAGTPTPFEYRGQQAELARVQRNYQTAWAVGAFVASAASQNFSTLLQFKVSMRGTPATSFAAQNNSGSSAVNGNGFNSITTEATNVVCTSNAAGWMNQSATVVADARL